MPPGILRNSETANREYGRGARRCRRVCWQRFASFRADTPRRPEHAPRSWALYQGFEEFERDLHHHVHLENNILFPRAVEMEQAQIESGGAVVVTNISLAWHSRKKLGKRALTEHSQTLRRAVQFTFLLLNLWIGVQFYLFVRYYETGGRSIQVSRPPGVEGWLPIASLMNLKALLLTGQPARDSPRRDTCS